MNIDITERIMDIFGIPGYWNLVWIIPACIGIGVVLAAFWPFGKGPEGPPYVSFDPGKKATGAKIYKPGDPPGTYGYEFGDTIHKQVEAYHRALLEDAKAEAGTTPHPGWPCGPQCWRKPDGHRWGNDGTD